MQSKTFIWLTAFFLAACQNKPTAQELQECPIDVHFSPKGGVTQSIVAGIKDSSSDIRIQAFSFTSRPIADALIEAKKSGKNVEAILDRENLGNKSSVMQSLYDNGITIYIDKSHAIAHNKVIIIDGQKVFTGSFNFSKGAEESNAENSLLISNKRIADLYMENWTLHKDHSHLFSPEN
jgi:phosphatidylserine/phosphatidylglycerophosphate/cardiolipin synthase-like enzyme